MGGAGYLDHHRVGHVRDQPGDTFAVVGKGRAASPEHRRHRELGRVERWRLETNGTELGDQCRAVGPPLRLDLVGQTLPRTVPHHPSEEALRGHGSVLVVGAADRAASRRPAPEAEPGEWGLVRAEREDGSVPRLAQSGTDCDDTAVAVPDHHRGATVDDGEEVVDMALDGAVHREHSGAVVAPSVVRDRVEIGQPAEHPGEAARPVERAMDENHEGAVASRAVGEVLGHGELVGRGHPRTAWQEAFRARQVGECTTPGAPSCIVWASEFEGEPVPVSKTDLIAAVAAHTGATSKDVAAVLGGLEDVVVANVAKGEKVVITGFVTFDRTQRAARTGRNPQTGEPLAIKASKSPKVTAGAAFKKVVNGQAPAPKLNRAR